MVAALGLTISSVFVFATGDSSYGWPVKPFNVQHPIRGKFDDPRAATRHMDDPGPKGASFHSGVDIVAPDGTPVYAVEKGQVAVESADHIAVTQWGSSLKNSHIFGYYHIRVVVKNKQMVSEHQLLGYILAGAGHVHLSEKLGGQYVDPLRRGALIPYTDNTKPTIQSISTYKNGQYQNLANVTVSGKINLTVNAFDTPPMKTPWPQEILTPSLIQWEIVNSRGKAVVPNRTAIDFSKYYDVNPKQVYAPGTLQNGPNRAGLYNFWLIQNLDTTKLAKGAYKLVLSASDNRGNKSTQTVVFNILN
jgi:hypothetical protein